MVSLKLGDLEEKVPEVPGIVGLPPGSGDRAGWGNITWRVGLRSEGGDRVIGRKNNGKRSLRADHSSAVMV